MTSNNRDLEEHLFWLFPQYFFELLICILKVFPVNVLCVQIFVQLEAVICSKVKVSNKIECIQSPFLVSLHVWQVRVSLKNLNNSVSFYFLPHVSVVLLHNQESKLLTDVVGALLMRIGKIFSFYHCL